MKQGNIETQTLRTVDKKGWKPYLWRKSFEIFSQAIGWKTEIKADLHRRNNSKEHSNFNVEPYKATTVYIELIMVEWRASKRRNNEHCEKFWTPSWQVGQSTKKKMQKKNNKKKQCFDENLMWNNE